MIKKNLTLCVLACTAISFFSADQSQSLSASNQALACKCQEKPKDENSLACKCQEKPKGEDTLVCKCKHKQKDEVSFSNLLAKC
jgi:hypothetical protein